MFKVERAVAEGGFGVVYRAYHEHFRADVALKCLKVPEALSGEKRDAFLERFRHEAELLFRLSAALPEIVRPLQFGLLDNKHFVPFIALEWLEGETLDAMVSARTAAGRPPLSLAEAVTLLTPVARALSRAHQFSDKKGTAVIVHRDMKPENVFLQDVEGEPVPRILDFGIARVRDEAGLVAGVQTKGDAVNAFSPAYAAPEQWNSAQLGAAGPWTDVYGLALTLGEAVIGAPPVQGDLTSMMGQHLSPRARPTPKARGVKLPADAELAFERALAVDPRARTQSVEAFWSQLEQALGRAPSQLSRRGRATSLHEAEESTLELPPLISAVARAQAPAPPRPTEPAAPAVLKNAPTIAAPVAKVGLAQVDFDDIGLAHGSSLEIDRPAMPRAARPRNRATESSAYVPPQPAGPPLGDRMRGPAWLAFLAIAVGAADFVLVRSGQGFTLGPVRIAWIAGAIGILAVVMAFFRAFDD